MTVNQPSTNHTKVAEYGIDLFELWDGKIRSLDVVAVQLGPNQQLLVR